MVAVPSISAGGAVDDLTPVFESRPEDKGFKLL